MKIDLIVEGQTEKALMSPLRRFLAKRLAGSMPRLNAVCVRGRVPKKDSLDKLVDRLLHNRPEPADHVIALTDVYTGTQPPDFLDAGDAKYKMRSWVRKKTRFHPHAAQFEFEAWLLPYWTDIQQRAKHNAAPPAGQPEKINHDRPPSSRIAEVFRAGNVRRHYKKALDAKLILQNKDLEIAASACPELKAFLNTILKICSGPTLP